MTKGGAPNVTSRYGWAAECERRGASQQQQRREQRAVKTRAQWSPHRERKAVVTCIEECVAPALDSTTRVLADSPGAVTARLTARGSKGRNAVLRERYTAAQRCDRSIWTRSSGAPLYATVRRLHPCVLAGSGVRRVALFSSCAPHRSQLLRAFRCARATLEEENGHTRRLAGPHSKQSRAAAAALFPALDTRATPTARTAHRSFTARSLSAAASYSLSSLRRSPRCPSHLCSATPTCFPPRVLSSDRLQRADDVRSPLPALARELRRQSTS